MVKQKLLRLLAIFSSVLFVVGTIAGCSDEYDDYDLWDKADELEHRIKNLEKKVNAANENMTSLQSVVAALQKGDMISECVRDTKDGREGWTVKFLNGKESIFIPDGKDGEKGEQGDKGDKGEPGNDGKTPTINVKKDVDGEYYWTVDGEYILVDGKKVPVTQTAPEFKVEENKLYVTYDGANWEFLTDLATESTVPETGLIKDIIQGENSIEFILNDDTKITIPLASAFAIDMEIGKDLAVIAGKTYEIPYTIRNASEGAEIDYMPCGNYEVEIVKTDYKSGTIKITVPATYENQTLLILAKDENLGKSTYKLISFSEGVLTLDNPEAKEISKDGGKVTFKITTNYDFNVEIEQEGEWVKLAPKTKAVETKELVLDVEKNDTGKDRTATVKLVDKVGGFLLESFVISQITGTVEPEPEPTPGEVLFSMTMGDDDPKPSGNWADLSDWFTNNKESLVIEGSQKDNIQLTSMGTTIRNTGKLSSGYERASGGNNLWLAKGKVLPSLLSFSGIKTGENTKISIEFGVNYYDFDSKDGVFKPEYLEVGHMLADALMPENVEYKYTKAGKYWYYVVATFDVEKNTDIIVQLQNTQGLRIDDILIVAGEGSEIAPDPTPDPDPEPSEVIKTTVAKFLEAEVSDTQWYELTGTIKNIKMDKYNPDQHNPFGNFDIEDESGSVFIYGLTATKTEDGSNDRSFKSLGLKEGEVITIHTLRKAYNGKPQGGGPAYFISKDEGGEVNPEPEPEPEPDDTEDILYMSFGTDVEKVNNNWPYFDTWFFEGKDKVGIQGTSKNSIEISSFGVSIRGLKTEYSSAGYNKASGSNHGFLKSASSTKFDMSWISVGKTDEVVIKFGARYFDYATKDTEFKSEYIKIEYKDPKNDAEFKVAEFKVKEAKNGWVYIETSKLPVTRDGYLEVVLTPNQPKDKELRIDDILIIPANADEGGEVDPVDPVDPDPEPTPDPDELDFSSNVTWNTDAKNNCSYSEKATVNGEADVKILKLGKSSKPGKAELVLPDGTYGLVLYGCAWGDGKDTKIVVKNGEEVLGEFTVKPHEAAKGKHPYTLNNIIKDNRYAIDFGKNLGEGLTVTIETTGTTKATYRALLFGIQAQTGSWIEGWENVDGGKIDIVFD